MSHLPIEIKAGSMLGINYSGSHDSAIAIVAPGGEITFACSLERITRRKQDGRFPQQLLDSVDLRKISVCALPCYARDAIPTGPTGQRFHTVRHGRSDYPPLEFPEMFYEQVSKINIPKVYVGHHLAHAASAYYLSGFPSATLLTYDAGYYNCPWFGGVFQAHGKNVDPVEYFPSSSNAKIASLYAIVTGLLGFSPLKHEGKITGLAAFGKPSERCVQVLKQLLTVHYAELESAGRWINVFHETKLPQFVIDSSRQKELRSLFGEASREEIAASLQYVTEGHVLEVVRAVKVKVIYPSPRLCLSGGLFSNVKLNQRVHELWGGQIFISPPMTDDGTALGAALYCAYQQGKTESSQSASHMYLGMAFDLQDVRQALDEERITYERLEEPAIHLAKLLAAGKLVAVFTGAMEFGPRALGHRSILAPATDPQINDWLNKKLHRTEFMPFAPITRIEDAELEYQNVIGAERAAEFMAITFNVTDHMRQTCPAVVHVDGTARPQLVRPETNRFLYDVLTAYYNLTGITSLINTSFNIHEEPIICTPADALKGFFEAQLDYLYIEGYLVALSENAHASVRYLAERAIATSLKEEALKDVIDFLWTENKILRDEADKRLEVIRQLDPGRNVTIEMARET